MKGLLVGYGSIGRRHLNNLVALGVEDWGVVRSSLGSLPFDPPVEVRVHTDLEQALDQEEPDLVVVANPTSLHVETALACARRGCAVLLEKPVAAGLEGVDALVNAVAASGSPVLVGFQFRFHPTLARLGAILEDGRVGRPLHARVTWAEYLPDWHPWEDWTTSYAVRPQLGGGVHHTLCHPFDYLLQLFGGAECRSAVLVDHGLLGATVAESADVLLAHDTGVVSSVHLDYWRRPPRHAVEICCAEGVLCWDVGAGTLTISAVGEEVIVEHVPGVAERDRLFEDEARHFLDVVRREAVPVCTLADGIAVAQICADVDRLGAESGAIEVRA